MINPQNYYVTINQAAELLHVNRLTIRRWIKDKRIKGYAMGLTTLIPKTEVAKVQQIPARTTMRRQWNYIPKP